MAARWGPTTWSSDRPTVVVLLPVAAVGGSIGLPGWWWQRLLRLRRKRWVAASFRHHLPLGNSFYFCSKYIYFNYSSLYVQMKPAYLLVAMFGPNNMEHGGCVVHPFSKT